MEKIEAILNKGTEIDLWDIKLEAKQAEVINEILKVDTFELNGVMRDFVELENDVNEIAIRRTFLKNALEIEEWCK